MNRSLIWRAFLVFLIVFLSLYLLYPSFKWYRLPKEVYSNKIIIEEDPRQKLLSRLKDLVPEGYELLLQRQKREKRRKDPLQERALRLGLDLKGGMYLVLEVDTSKIDQEKKRRRIDPVEVVLEIIRDRIDEFGVAEPSIQRQGDNRIIVQLPGLSDPERAIELIGKTGLLEFKLVEDEIFDQIQQKAKDLGLGMPEGVYLVKKEAELTGRYLTDADINFDEYNQPYVELTLDKEGALFFEKTTGENINRRLAIVLDGYVASAPVIKSKISGGKARIEGNFTLDEAKDLAIVLRQGALPAPVKILRQNEVGPTLGQDLINKGVVATIIGFFLITIFMAVRYKFSGLVADIALFFNVIILLAILALFKGTLTLPGIAGIALTIGMAVDANVIIFERIREELRSGRRLRTSIDNGYNRAFSAILDANLTTLIAAVVLFQFGTGPIKGFGLTLSMGILASMFTAIFATKIIFDLVASRQRREKLSI